MLDLQFYDGDQYVLPNTPLTTRAKIVSQAYIILLLTKYGTCFGNSTIGCSLSPGNSSLSLQYQMLFTNTEILRQIKTDYGVNRIEIISVNEDTGEVQLRMYLDDETISLTIEV